ncbi:cytochrome P450, partial [Lasiosphaeria miniovina]
RAEVRRVLSRHGDVLCPRALQCTRRLDSFVTETMRVGPHSINTFQREVTRPFRPSTGQEMPAGVVIEVPAHAVAHDPEIFPDPDRFDGLRFYRSRAEGRHFVPDYQHHFDSCKETFLTFGYGHHAFPGRSLASKNVKAIVAKVLILCETKLVDGVTEQYPNLTFGPMSFPSPTKELLFKKINQCRNYLLVSSVFKFGPRMNYT